MNRFVKTLVAVGVAMVVVRLVKGRGRSVTSIVGPAITVSGETDGLRLQVVMGSFANTGAHWHHKHTAGEPRTLRVTLEDDAHTFPEDNRVDIHTSHGTLVIQREREAPADPWAAYVRAKDGSQPEHPAPGRLVFWPRQNVTIESVEVADVTRKPPSSVTVTQPI